MKYSQAPMDNHPPQSNHRRARLQWMEARFPGLIARARSIYHILRPGLSPHRTVARKLAGRYGWRVLKGPFASMRYPWWTPGGVSSIAPKLLGCYEAELHTLLQSIVSKGYRVVVNAGSAEGYYAVGLARRMPSATVYAFEIAAAARALCREMAKLNEVEDRVIVDGECTVDTLRSVPLSGSLVLCDVEGAEADLIHPALIPALRRSDLLIELHDRPSGHITKLLAERLRSSHRLTIIRMADVRDQSTLPYVEFLTPEERTIATSEYRSISTGWMYAASNENG